MREILFRGKDAESGEWVYGAFVPDLREVYFGDEIDGFIKPFGKTKEERLMVEVDRETVGQYTGLCDKSGLTRIFENDIISAHPDELFPDDEIRLVVEWHDYGWFGKDSKGRYTSLESKWVSEFFEVIGNRFDNPELLGGEENG